MRRQIIATAGLAVLAVVLPMPATAQTQPTGGGQPATATTAPVEPPAFNTARTPTSPAFTLFGLEPASVERPANPADLAISFATQAKDAAGVPEDFAIEFSPFWLVSRPFLSWSADKARSPWQSLQRTASFSIGTGQIGTDEAPVTGLAIGGRASILSGELSDELEAQIKRLETQLTNQATMLNALMAPALERLRERFNAREITVEQLAEETAKIQALAVKSKLHTESAEYKAVVKTMEKFATVRDGWFLEVAGAAGWRYPEAVWKEGSFDRWALWVTPSYVAKQSSVVGVFRYLSKDVSAGTEDGVLDVGVRGILFRDRYALSVEYMRRSFEDDALEAGHRFVGIAEYAVRDGTWLVATFGRDRDTAQENSLVARLGLSFSFAKERHVAPQ
jgi:hypothetical protein